MTYKERFLTLREEARKLRQETATRFRAWERQKKKSDRLEKENERLKKELEDLQKLLEECQERLERETSLKEKYQGMIFRPAQEVPPLDPMKRKPGGQLGHSGKSRKTPKRIDQEKRVFLSACPECDSPLVPGSSTALRTVEDIVLPLSTIITRYHIERQ